MTSADDPHAQQPVLAAGAALPNAKAAMIMVHGRGAGPKTSSTSFRSWRTGAFAHLILHCKRITSGLSFPIGRRTSPSSSSAPSALARVVESRAGGFRQSDRAAQFSQGRVHL